VTVQTINAPASFTAVLYEDGAGDRFFMNNTIDWNTADESLADGNPYYIHSWNTTDQNFKGNMWFQVT
jgi:hypothetical protein